MYFFPAQDIKDTTLKYIEHAKTLNSHYAVVVAAIKQYAINDLLSQRKPTHSKSLNSPIIRRLTV